MTISVLGAGNWGTTIALLLHGNGHSVRLWEYNDTLAEEMITHRENRTYLPGFPLPQDLHITSDMNDAVSGAEMIAFVVPSSVMRQTAHALGTCKSLHKDALLVTLSKGLEHESLKTMGDVISDEIPAHSIVALSGPCIASEVVHGQPTTIVSASTDSHAAKLVQDSFMTSNLRVYTSPDPKGIQLGGSLKNIIAIAAGINDGLGFGANAKSALVTRGIVEIKRFGVSLGAEPETFNGLSGIGDLITTCFSKDSRNRHVGEELGRGRSLTEILDSMVMVAEGVPTAKNVWEYSRNRGIEMPITSKVYSILFENESPAQAVPDLMLRDRKSEVDTDR